MLKPYTAIILARQLFDYMFIRIFVAEETGSAEELAALKDEEGLFRCASCLLRQYSFSPLSLLLLLLLCKQTFSSK
ncbi:unnamed protein product [Lactuca virosa]|uniref:Uncharacterized protein n=1 Tax=Lactuca virosa TaxID=75947 RepID=A0AAU9NRS6_9ASTR|nr:unnamed protein product [Lactuca virosa]